MTHQSFISIQPPASVSDRFGASQACRSIEVSPDDAVRRRNASWRGISAEIVRITRPGKVVTRFKAPVHMLVAHEHGVRRDGETQLEGVPSSALKDLKRKLTFVPAGHRYVEWLDSRTLPQITYFYLDPTSVPELATDDEEGDGLAPRLFFEDPSLWDTVSKLNALIETSEADDHVYLEALGSVLVHELARMKPRGRTSRPPARGGLAAWQERIVIEHIENHLAETPQLSTLANLARLSPQHFCRAFKQSLGQPPIRYQGMRRIERAKLLLARAETSVTEIGLSLGYSETSSFTAAFRRATGLTPTGYRRSLS